MPKQESRNKMLLTSSCIANVARMLRPLRATSSIFTILVISSLLISTNSISADSPNSPTSASSQNSNQTHLTQQQSTSSNIAQTSKTSAADSKSSGKNGAGQQQQQVSIVEQQPTDLSSMYVQIPIAEPADTGVPDGVQQTLTSTGDTDSNGAAQDSKASSWTGPWPKKFQIGYIKQSDLHQVLIESLKNEPFVALGSPSAATKGGQAQQASTPSPAAARKVVPSSPEVVAQKPVQWPQSSPAAAGFGSQRAAHQQPLIKNNNVYHHRPAMQAFRDTSSSLLKPFHVAHNRFHQMNNFQAHQTRPVLNQQPQKLLPIAGNPGNFHQQHQQQAQYHFGFPMNSFKNEPIYTINNYPHQEQLDQNSMQLLMPTGQQQQQFGQSAPMMGRPQKSTEFQTSTAWRPVTNGDKSENPMQLNQQQAGSKGLAGQISVGQIQSMSVDYPNLNDGFDDGFSMPNKDASFGGSMNRHPMLNNYLNNLDSNAGNRSARMSPSLQAKMKLQSLSPAEGTKSAGPEGSQLSSKGAGTKSTGAKGAADNSSTLSVNRRRAQNGTSTTAVSTSSGAPTTVAPTSAAESESANSSTTAAPSPSITTGASSITTTTSAESDTQEPDSEVIDSDTTEPSTTASSSQSSGGSSTSGSSGDPSPREESTTSASSTTGSPDVGSNQSDNGETEVVTQGNSVQQASAGGLPASSMTDSEPTRTSTVSSTTGSTREDTTPSSGSTPSGEEGAKKGGEVEGSAGSAEALSKTRMNSMSDEALMAASLGAASELGKTTASNGSGQAASQQLGRSRSRGTSTGASSSKRTRSPERLVQPSASSAQEPAASNEGRKTASSSANNNKLITKRPQSSASSRSAKQVSADALGGVKGAKLQAGKSSRKAAKKSASLGTKAKAAALAASRSVGGSARAGLQSERLQQQPQVVSMTAAQAQSTAQTLASLLLSRCMSSSSCAHLLDICTTKQAMVSLNAGAVQPVDNSIEPASPSSATNQLGPVSNNQSSGAWSMPVGLMSSSIMSLTQSLQADKVLKALPQWKDAIENVVDHDTQTGYTLILPSNEALDRMLPSTIDSWLANSELLSQIIDNHMLDSAETIDFMPNQSGRKPVQSRVIKNKGLQVNQHREKMVTINGKRLVYANQVAPSGGRIHVIDGFLDWPLGISGSNKLLDIMDTLKQCDKFDGFVTLAEGTGLTQILKQDGPMTVFVPSNEALRKIPDEELEVIKNNSTALKEFLMYHVVNGSYFSQDLRDGQQLASILDMKPIQVGVRVDGCSRRLVEANTSPMRRPDIVAKNGVIHILDWYLTVRDNEWCEPIGKFASTSTPSIASERLQQLASEPEATYATRMAMPINHKPAMSGQLNEGLLMVQSVSGNVPASKQLSIGSSAGAVASPVAGNIVVSDDNAQNIIVTPSPSSSADSLANSRASS